MIIKLAKMQKLFFVELILEKKNWSKTDVMFINSINDLINEGQIVI